MTRKKENNCTQVWSQGSREAEEEGTQMNCFVKVIGKNQLLWVMGSTPHSHIKKSSKKILCTVTGKPIEFWGLKNQTIILENYTILWSSNVSSQVNKQLKVSIYWGKQYPMCSKECSKNVFSIFVRSKVRLKQLKCPSIKKRQYNSCKSVPLCYKAERSLVLRCSPYDEKTI